mmetsp:Transcript_56009/g.77650  ORF Transcript_56009/g.77650 Transcript_56009/m.77650 type:complete len:92 (-) Transcript_56009:290-565(-)
MLYTQTRKNNSIHTKAERNSSLHLLGAVDGKIDQTVTVSPFVVIPGDDLVEVVVKCDACLGINDRGALVVDEILRNKGFVAVSKNSLHGSF